MCVKNMGHFTCSKCKLASMLWFAHFGMKIGDGAQLLNCSHLVFHTSNSTHSPCEFDWSKVFLGEVKQDKFLCITSFSHYNPRIERVIVADFLP